VCGSLSASSSIDSAHHAGLLLFYDRLSIGRLCWLAVLVCTLLPRGISLSGYHWCSIMIDMLGCCRDGLVDRFAGELMREGTMRAEIPVSGMVE
jgi:hypothetical protein